MFERLASQEVYLFQLVIIIRFGVFNSKEIPNSQRGTYEKVNLPETALQSMFPDDRVLGTSLPCLSTHQHCLGSPLLLVHCIG